MYLLRTRTSSYNDCLMTNEKEGPAVHGGVHVGRAQGRDVGGVDEQGAPGVKAGS